MNLCVSDPTDGARDRLGRTTVEAAGLVAALAGCAFEAGFGDDTGVAVGVGFALIGVYGMSIGDITISVGFSPTCKCPIILSSELRVLPGSLGYAPDSAGGRGTDPDNVDVDDENEGLGSWRT